MLPSRAQNPRQNSRRGEQAWLARRTASRRSKCAATGPRDTPRAATTGAKVEAAIRARLVRGEGIKKVAKAIGVGNATVRGQGGDGQPDRLRRSPRRASPSGEAFPSNLRPLLKMYRAVPVPWQRRRQWPYPTQPGHRPAHCAISGSDVQCRWVPTALRPRRSLQAASPSLECRRSAKRGGSS